MNKKFILILIPIVLIVLIAIFFLANRVDIVNTEGEVGSNKTGFLNLIPTENPNIKNYENKITGEIINSELEPEFLNRRPLAVMVNNAVPARPQIGLTEADIVYEVIAEGGITRFLAFYYSSLPEVVGPIRSTREYYLTIAKELGDSMLMHIGYSPQAREKIDSWDIKSLGLNGGSFFRDNFGDSKIATEHTAFGNGKDLYETGKNLGWGEFEDFESWKFKSEKAKTEDLPDAKNIEISFWFKGDYSGIFLYNSDTNKYIRHSGFDEDINPLLLEDRLTNKRIEVSNLIVQFAEEFPIPNDDKGRLDYKLIGEGTAYIFRDGKFQNGIWKKDSLKSRTKFYLASGEEIEFNRGKFWVSIVPSRNINQVIIK